MPHKADERKQCGLLGYVHTMVCEGSGQLPGGKTCGNAHFINLCELGWQLLSEQTMSILQEIC